MFIVFVCMPYVKKFGCHYNQSGVLKIDILILLRLERFQNLGTPPTFSCWVKVHKTAFTQVYMKEVNFHEFIYFNQYIVCFFNEILPTVPSNKMFVSSA